MMEGIVFDIQKFALHDGPGIRTAVFLKGCPLRCAWCCNPESQRLRPQISYDKGKCTGCRKCIDACSLSLLSGNGDKLLVNFADCSACGSCIDECSVNALRIYGYRTDAASVIEEVMKDKDYYDNSRGGLTLSGGETMAQFEFALELLKMAKEKGLHTVIETSGYAATAKYRQIMPYVDLFLYDYKHTGNQLHSKYTQVEQDLILRNLDFLYGEKAEILVRCPIIPGINDTPEHFTGIRDLSLRYPGLKGIEILGYHDYGMWKYEQLGMTAYTITATTVSKVKLGEWKVQLKNLGCNNLIN
jgi:pyruvate formate lyase activating enzyme